VEGIVTLIVYYVVFMIVGDFAAYFLGLFTEYEWGSQVSLIVFLVLYFLFLWVSWVLAVWVTKPKTAEQQSSWPRRIACGEPQMAELSRDEVVEVLGRLSDVIIAEIIATGITKDELAAARERVVTDRKAHNPGPPLEPGPFAQVVDILERSPGRGILGEAGSTLE
jgi:uncharacterized membrane protein